MIINEKSGCLPATFKVAVLDIKVPISSEVATHWYIPSSGRFVRVWYTVEKYNDPFDKSLLKVVIWLVSVNTMLDEWNCMYLGKCKYFLPNVSTIYRRSHYIVWVEASKATQLVKCCYLTWKGNWSLYHFQYVVINLMIVS